MQGMIGEVRLFGGNFAPRNWADCSGQLLPISSNTALFSIIGTIYGGDGRTTFALPDLRGRTAIGPGSGPGLPTYREGERVGTETNTMTIATMPSHSHTGATGTGTVRLGAGAATATIGSDNSLASSAAGNIFIAAAPNTNLKLAGNPVATTVTVNNTGGQQPINNLQPYLAIRYIICLQGIFPSRN